MCVVFLLCFGVFFFFNSAVSVECSYKDTTVYLSKGTKYSLEMHQLSNMLNFNENICLKTRQVQKTFEVKMELSFQEVLGIFRMAACLPTTILKVLHFFIAHLFP